MHLNWKWRWLYVISVHAHTHLLTVGAYRYSLIHENCSNRRNTIDSKKRIISLCVGSFHILKCNTKIVCVTQLENNNNTCTLRLLRSRWIVLKCTFLSLKRLCWLCTFEIFRTLITYKCYFMLEHVILFPCNTLFLLHMELIEIIYASVSILFQPFQSICIVCRFVDASTMSSCFLKLLAK